MSGRWQGGQRRQKKKSTGLERELARLDGAIQTQTEGAVEEKTG